MIKTLTVVVERAHETAGWSMLHTTPRTHRCWILHRLHSNKLDCIQTRLDECKGKPTVFISLNGEILKPIRGRWSTQLRP